MCASLTPPPERSRSTALRTPPSCATPTACVGPDRSTTGNAAVVVIVVVLLPAVVLCLAGFPVGAVLGLLAGACAISVETARRLGAAAAL